MKKNHRERDAARRLFEARQKMARMEFAANIIAVAVLSGCVLFMTWKLCELLLMVGI